MIRENCCVLVKFYSSSLKISFFLFRKLTQWLQQTFALIHFSQRHTDFNNRSTVYRSVLSSFKTIANHLASKKFTKKFRYSTVKTNLSTDKKSVILLLKILEVPCVYIVKRWQRATLKFNHRDVNLEEGVTRIYILNPNYENKCCEIRASRIFIAWVHKAFSNFWTSKRIVLPKTYMCKYDYSF